MLVIAGQVQRGGKHVTPETIETAREAGASDVEIHDTVLIAAAFCMYNCYVDGLATWAPRDPEAYVAMGKRVAEQGYVTPGSADRAVRSEPLAFLADAVRLLELNQPSPTCKPAALFKLGFD